MHRSNCEPLARSYFGNAAPIRLTETGIMIGRILKNYVLRHQNRLNQLLHLCGVPLTFVASVVLLIYEQWLWAGSAFVAGYALQFIGHAIEGNDAGEVVLIKKLLGKPYVEFGPMSKESKFDD